MCICICTRKEVCIYMCVYIVCKFVCMDVSMFVCECACSGLGHCLLERYGMTEVGMALSNSYRGTRKVVSFC